jgi:hypothetical protein
VERRKERGSERMAKSKKTERHEWIGSLLLLYLSITFLPLGVSFLLGATSLPHLL